MVLSVSVKVWIFHLVYLCLFFCLRLSVCFLSVCLSFNFNFFCLSFYFAKTKLCIMPSLVSISASLWICSNSSIEKLSGNASDYILHFTFSRCLIENYYYWLLFVNNWLWNHQKQFSLEKCTYWYQIIPTLFILYLEGLNK